MASVSTPFTQYSKLVTSRLRSRAHGQSFSNTVMERERRRLSPAAKATIARVDALLALKQEHRRSFDPTLKAKAVQQLQALPLLSSDEDPHFVCTLRALRVAAYFEAIHSPATVALLNHLTKHAYLLDGFNIHQLAKILLELQHPRSQEVLTILLPRIREVLVDDVTAAETCVVLEALCTFEVGQQDDVLAQRCALVMCRTIEDLSLADVGRCVAALPYLPSRLHAREVLTAAERRLRELLDEAVVSRRVYTEEVLLRAGEGEEAAGLATTTAPTADVAEDFLERAERARRAERESRALLLTNMRESVALMRGLLRASTWLGWAPRRVLMELVRAVVAYTDPRPRRVDSPTEGRATAPAFPVVFEEEERELAALWQAMPGMGRKDVAQLLRLLSVANCRHECALRVLAGRVATCSTDAVPAEAGVQGGLGPPGDSQVQGESRGGKPPSEINVLLDLSTAVEALAFFLMRDASATVAALVEEVVQVREGSSAFRTPQQMLILVDIQSRLLLSLARLQYPQSVANGSGYDTLVKLLRDDVTSWFSGGPTCGQEPLLAAQLATGIAQVEAALTCPTPQSEAVGGVRQPSAHTVRQLSQLLEGVGRGGAAKLLAASSTTGPMGRAEAQLAVANAASAVKALNCTDARLLAALSAVEDLSLKLL